MLISKLAMVNIKLNVAAANEMVRGGMHSPISNSNHKEHMIRTKDGNKNKIIAVISKY